MILGTVHLLASRGADPSMGGGQNFSDGFKWGGYNFSVKSKGGSKFFSSMFLQRHAETQGNTSFLSRKAQNFSG